MRPRGSTANEEQKVKKTSRKMGKDIEQGLQFHMHLPHETGTCMLGSR